MSGGKSFVPLTLGLLEQGDLLDECNKEFQRLQRELCKFVDHYADRAKGAEATLTLKIKIKCESVEDGVYGIDASYSTKLPARPSRNTKAIQVTEENGVSMLCVRDTGSTPGDPSQLHLPLVPPVEATTPSQD